MSFSIVGSVFTETSGCFAGLFLDNSSSTDKKASRYEARISTTATTGLLFFIAWKVYMQIVLLSLFRASPGCV